jgi:hypothetical protein
VTAKLTKISSFFFLLNKEFIISAFGKRVFPENDFC